MNEGSNSWVVLGVSDVPIDPTDGGPDKRHGPLPKGRAATLRRHAPLPGGHPRLPPGPRRR